jgi:hypothetical protein
MNSVCRAALFWGVVLTLGASSISSAHAYKIKKVCEAEENLPPGQLQAKCKTVYDLVATLADLEARAAALAEAKAKAAIVKPPIVLPSQRKQAAG